MASMRELAPVSPLVHHSLSGLWCHRPLASLGRGLPQTTGDACLRAAGCLYALVSRMRDVPRPSGGKRKMVVEKLWREFFSDPSQWWDNRMEKKNALQPDFKHKKTRDRLWVIDFSSPPWVEEKLAALPPRSLQSSLLSWNKRLARYVTAREYEKTLELFQRMQQEGVDPDKLTFVPVLNACASLQALEEGRRIHTLVVQSGHVSDVFVGNCLVDMYSKCDRIEDALKVFNKMPKRNVFSWNAMIHGYVKSGQEQKALELSRRMSMGGVRADHVTFLGVLNACAGVAALQEGRCIHKQIIERGLESNVYVQSGLVDFYAKCGIIDVARRVFDRMPKHNVASWTAIILGYVKCEEWLKALEISRKMFAEMVDPGPIALVGVLEACATLGALQEGRHVHKKIIQSGCVTSDLVVGNSLIDMYTKCGSMDDACSVFEEMPVRNIDTWNAMLSGFALHGLGKEALEHFKQMQQEGVQVNGLTFVSLLTACCRGGLVSEGLYYFKSMQSIYSTSPTVDHYSCVVELLGRAGLLDEAEDLIKTMTFGPDATAWMCFLDACTAHGNAEIGEWAAKRVLELDLDNTADPVLLSDLYTRAGKWTSSANVQRERLQKGLKKLPGYTWIEVNGHIHSFTVDDCEHPQIVEIQGEIKRLSKLITEAGYVLQEAETKFQLAHHSENLAIAFGLISIPPDARLSVFKNSRVCGDGHTATKFISKVIGRAIIVRDGNRFHHFQNGLCSCGDYW